MSISISFPGEISVRANANAKTVMLAHGTHGARGAYLQNLASGHTLTFRIAASFTVLSDGCVMCDRKSKVESRLFAASLRLPSHLSLSLASLVSRNSL